MANDKSGGFNLKTFVILMAVVIATSVGVTLLQALILGKPHVAITGGVVGALTAGIWVNMKRKKSENGNKAS